MVISNKLPKGTVYIGKSMGSFSSSSSVLNDLAYWAKGVKSERAAQHAMATLRTGNEAPFGQKGAGTPKIIHLFV